MDTSGIRRGGVSKSVRQRQKWGTRFKVLERDNFRCHWCGVPAREAKLVMDHAMPLAAAGEDHARNLVASCEPCNGGKGARILGRVHEVKEYQAFHMSDPSAVVGSACCGFCERATVEFREGDTVLVVGVQGKEQWAPFAEALRRAADEIEAGEAETEALTA